MLAILRCVAWGCLAFIAYATLAPITQRPQIHTGSSYFDLLRDFDHYLAFAVLGALFSAAYPRHTAWVCIIVLGGAILLELSQFLTPDRHGRILDAIQKCIGGAVGIVLVRSALFARSRWAPK